MASCKKLIPAIENTVYARLAGLFALFAVLIVQAPVPAAAQSSGYHVASCIAKYGPVSFWTNHDEIRSIKIVQKTPGPARPLLPGQTYNMRYDVISKCKVTCSYIKPFNLHIYATGVDNRNNIRSPNKLVGLERVAEHDCDKIETRVITLTVPDPAKVGGKQTDDVSWVTIAVCPPSSSRSCSSHTIEIRNTSDRGWQVSAPSPRQRAIGAGVNRVASGKPATLTARLSNHTGRVLWPASGARLRLKQISGPQTTLPAPVGVPEIGLRKSHTASFRVGPLSPGIYAFQACLQGLKDGRGFPIADVCGPAVALTAGVPDAAGWKVSGFAVNAAGKLTDRARSGKSFRGNLLVHNLSGQSYKRGTRFVTVWRRDPASQRLRKIHSGDLGDIASGASVSKNIRVQPQRSGRYDFKVCTAGDRNARIINSVCGPWSPIAIGTTERNKDAEDHQVDLKCRGDQVFNRAARTCACPASRPRWDTQAGLCAQQVQVALCADSKRRRADGKCCPRGQVARLNRCVRVLVCPEGARKKGRVCVCRGVAKWNKSRNQCRCPKGASWNGKSCHVRLRCPEGSRKVGNRCDCPRPARWSPARKKCVFPAQNRCKAPFKYDRGSRKCVCPRGFSKIGGTCRKRSTVRPLRCPPGARKAGRSCICRRPAVWRASKNICQCPRGFQWRGGRCRK